MSHCHADGTSDEIFRSMRSNCEAYKKKDMELVQAKQQVAQLTEGIAQLTEGMAQLTEGMAQLTEENGTLKSELLKYIINKPKQVPLKTWNDHILYVCRDRVKRSSIDIFALIHGMDSHPWKDDAKTPEATCGTTCRTLVTAQRLHKTTSYPLLYYLD